MANPTVVRFAISIPSINSLGDQEDKQLVLSLTVSLEALSVEGCSEDVQVILMSDTTETVEVTPAEPSPIFAPGPDPDPPDPNPPSR